MSIARHTTYNVVGALTPVVVSIVTVPLYVKAVGLDRYGILNLCWLLVGYFGFFDFGIGRATAQQVARAEDNVARRQKAFWAGVTLSIGLALLATVVAAPLIKLALASLKLGTPMVRESAAALPLLVASTPLGILQSPFRGALEGRRQFLALNVILSLGSIGTAAAPLVAANLISPAVPVLIAASLGVRLLVVCALGLAAGVLLRVGHYRAPNRESIHPIMRFGAWLTVTNVVGPLMVFIDRFLIGAMVGAAAVGAYVIPFNLVGQLLVLPTGLGNALFPRFAAIGDDAYRLKRDALVGLSVVLTFGCMAAMLLVGPFLHLWIGEAAASQSTPVALVLIVGLWGNGLAQIPHARLQAGGRTDAVAKVHVAELIPYLAVLWVGISQFGIVGAAVAWSIRALVDFVALSVIDGRLSGMKRLLVPQGLSLVLLSILAASPTPTLLKWGLAIVMCLAVGGYLGLMVRSEVRSRFGGPFSLASLRRSLRLE